MKKIHKVLVFSALLTLLAGCGINSNIMLKTPKDFEFADIDSLNETKLDYVIDVNDIIQMRFFTNKGLKVLNIATSNTPGQAQIFNPNNTLNYVIQNDSLVFLPIVGETNIVGMTIRQAEIYVAQVYEEFYVDPFVQISVTNRRVIVFPGTGSDAKVLYLSNNNVTLIEAIALAGGLAERGRASRVKLLRKTDSGKREIYKIDLSKIDNEFQYTDIFVQANDIIYVEPVPELGREILKEVTPIISLISSAAIVISVINALK